jgi:16S rRNA (adenine1518-N6/adenine1519-N6)-dimethyltransferase
MRRQRGELPEGPEPPDPPVLRRFGQHFLSDPRILARIVAALELSGAETVVEIGAGRGGLTEHLSRTGARVVAIEIDRALAQRLRERFPSGNVEVVEGDALTMSFAELAGGPFRVVGNIPYNITTPLIFQCLRSPRPELSVLLVQSEVADRAAAVPGSKRYGALTVNVQTLATVQRVFSVPRGAFQPPPDVDSAVIRMRPLVQPLLNPLEESAFQEFTRSLFAMRRKQVQRSLRSLRGLSHQKVTLLLTHCGIDSSARPETLTPAMLVQLFRSLREAGGPETELPGQD